MSRSPPKPIFGLEIEIFVKVKREVKEDVLGYRYEGLGERLPVHWQAWDFDLVNSKPNRDNGYGPRQARQRQCVKMALTALIKDALGARSGWKCVGDASLKEWRLKDAPDPKHWCTSLFRFVSQGLTGGRGRRNHLAAHVGGQEMAKRDPRGV
jgi:hypothetical protein